jgi:hypothetical protein
MPTAVDMTEILEHAGTQRQSNKSRKHELTSDEMQRAELFTGGHHMALLLKGQLYGRPLFSLYLQCKLCLLIYF